MTLRRLKFLQRFGVDLQAPAFDIRLWLNISSTVWRNMKLTISSFFSQILTVDVITFSGKGVLKAPFQREIFLEHLALVNLLLV